jgi:hypothetical protein
MVLEFFVNFGYLGVFAGFIVLGWIISRIDRISAHHLLNGRYWEFSRLYLVGIIAIDPLLRPFFVVAGALIAWLLVTALMMVWPRKSGVGLRVA